MSKCPQVEIAELKEEVALCEIITKRTLRDDLRLRDEIGRLTAENAELKRCLYGEADFADERYK